MIFSLSSTLEDNIKMDLGKIVFEGVDCVQLVQDRVQHGDEPLNSQKAEYL